MCVTHVCHTMHQVGFPSKPSPPPPATPPPPASYTASASLLPPTLYRYLYSISKLVTTDDVQGRLGDCSFVGAMALIAENQAFVNRVMDVALTDNNLFVINLWWAGTWRRIVIDGYLPVDDRGRTVFASCEDHSRYWAALVEKAAAKLRGSYGRMVSISMADSMMMLAGAMCIDYNRKDGGDFVDFALCDKWQRRGALFGASCQRDGVLNGIQGHHAYSVMQFVTHHGEQLVKLRNPWGRDVWTGQWSPTSDKYKRLLLPH